jgi:hypothetical protein
VGRKGRRKETYRHDAAVGWTWGDSVGDGARDLASNKTTTETTTTCGRKTSAWD